MNQKNKEIMKKYFIASIEDSIEVIAFKAESEEKLREKAKKCGINVWWVIKEVKEEMYNNWNGFKVEIP